ncbi:Imm49 family immunity protein [Streptomyces sp. NPDC002990]
MGCLAPQPPCQACHARRRGWTIRVESPYLPQGLLRAAEPF